MTEINYLQDVAAAEKRLRQRTVVHGLAGDFNGQHAALPLGQRQPNLRHDLLFVRKQYRRPK